MVGPSCGMLHLPRGGEVIHNCETSLLQSFVFCMYECAGTVVSMTTATVSLESTFFLITESF